MKMRPVGHAIGCAEHCLEGARELHPPDRAARHGIAQEDGRRCRGDGRDLAPGPDSLERLHRIGSDLEAGPHLLEGGGAFEHQGFAPGDGRSQGGCHPGDSAAGNEDGELFHKRHSAMPGGDFNAAD